MEKVSRKIKKEQTKELLLQTAYTYFSEHGISGARISDIALAAGVSHGTVFVHFETQEALITEVVETCCGKIVARTHELADDCSSLRQLLSAHLVGLMEYELFYTRLITERPLLPTSVRDAMVGIQSAVSLHFSEVAQRAILAGEITGIAPYMLFNMWIGLVHYYLSNGDLYAPEGNVLRRHGETLIKHFMKLAEKGGANISKNEVTAKPDEM